MKNFYATGFDITAIIYSDSQKDEVRCWDRAISSPGKPGFCSGSAPVLTLLIDDLQAFQELGQPGVGLPLQRMK